MRMRLARRGFYDPFNLSLIPGELFNFNPLSTSPFTLMRRVSDEMDRMFATALSGAGTSGTSGGAGVGMSTWAPAIEVKERNNQLEISADLPGMTKDDVKVEVTNDAVQAQMGGGGPIRHLYSEWILAGSAEWTIAVFHVEPSRCS
jgi:hypothetical protein